MVSSRFNQSKHYALTLVFIFLPSSQVPTTSLRLTRTSSSKMNVIIGFTFWIYTCSKSTIKMLSLQLWTATTTRVNKNLFRVEKKTLQAHFIVLNTKPSSSTHVEAKCQSDWWPKLVKVFWRRLITSRCYNTVIIIIIINVITLVCPEFLPGVPLRQIVCSIGERLLVRGN